MLAGTQGAFGHKKTDRMMALAEKANAPILFFVEGGGGRPGDVDFQLVTTGGLDLPTWFSFARLSGKIPRIAIVGDTVLQVIRPVKAGCADVIIATEDSSLGMGGPAMIEGGGLGQFHPKEVGPAKELSTKGVIDILVKDEEEAVQVAKKYLSYFQGEKRSGPPRTSGWPTSILPEDRRYAYMT